MDPRRRRSAIGARESAERAAHYLAGDPCVQLVYGFGSATQRDRATVRDVDLAVLTDPPLTLEDLTKRQRSEEHTSELQSRLHLVCRLLLEKKKKKRKT